jgi:hypothetical protein
MKALAVLLLFSSLGCASSPPPAADPKPAEPAPAASKPVAPAEEDDGVEGGVEGPVTGGVVGGVVSSGPPAEGKPANLPPKEGVARRLVDVTDARWRPRVRPEYYRSGALYWGLYKLCVSTAGQVTSVATMKSTGVPDVDGDWKETMKSWPHQPLTMNGKVYPFCYPLRLEVRMTPKKRG